MRCGCCWEVSKATRCRRTLAVITRYSSRRSRLGDFLPNLLHSARSYDRIAGYFSSSILEVAGEALESMAEGACVRVICNSELSALDILTARAAKQAMYREWCRSLPADVSPAMKRRLERLYGFLASGRLKVRVLPDERFGLLHGKAGVVTRADESRVAFMGSANESRSAWELNYEIVWADESEEGVAWVQEEFEALWTDPWAIELADAVIVDVQRLVRRVVIQDLDTWKERENADPGVAAIELPVYRRENGLWAHQKYFVRLAFERHRQGGARLVLADQVGLGKTVQLALAAKLMALWGGGRVLVLAPKTLLRQWRDEMWHLLQLPSAVWTGRGWEDESEILHPTVDADGLRRCPRRVGIVSSGLVTQSSGAADTLLGLDYECVILDEAHRARRRNLGRTHRNERADPNKLLGFLKNIANQTRSLLLATATPVQLDPIEAWDLLDALNVNNESILGTRFSQWRLHAWEGLDYVLKRETPPADLADVWEWVRDPFPPRDESRDFEALRRRISLSDDRLWAAPEDYYRLQPPDRARLLSVSRTFFARHNPFIRHIVRRTREFLENTLDLQTNEPYLKPVRVRLFGEGEQDAVPLPTFLRDAYDAAEDFCAELGKRPNMRSGFLRTLLLRRVGSSIEAGRRTARKILGPDEDWLEEEEDEDLTQSSLQPLSEAEQEKLRRFLALLMESSIEDPKFQAVVDLLERGADNTGRWLDRGCIVFSQYYDTANWVARRLSTRFPDETVALYAGASKSGVYRDGEFERMARETIKEMVRREEVRLMIGTDAASEGLNLQKIGSLINLDLPWNPTRLEQRKGRIQRIGQVRNEVYVYNMRYRGSVEDRVHDLLSQRLQAVSDLFGQLPDTLEDVWVYAALRDDQKAREIIDEIPKAHPFEIRYDRIEPVDWESCSQVLDAETQLEPLLQGW